MPTSIPPHNPREICAALKLLIEKPSADVEELIELVPGPDFPTGGILCGQGGIRHAYATGRGNGILRARAECFDEEKGKRARIEITEIPYQVNKTSLIEAIAGLVKDGRVTSIHDIQDHSDREGLLIVVDLKKGEDPQVTLNQLYKYTQLQTTISIINIALVDSRPRTLSLAGLMHAFLDHRRVVIRRRTQFLLGVAKDRLHIVDGLRIAVAHIDEVIATIRGAASTDDARSKLQARFELSERQSEAIVNMRLRALTGLEVEKLEAEWRELVAEIARLEGILADPRKIDAIIVEDLDKVAANNPAPRRTEIGEPIEGFEDEDLIPDETVVVTISNQGYLKRMTLDNYRSQRRGGSGIKGGDAREGDFLEQLFTANTKDSLLFFTGSGKVHLLKVWRLPNLSRTALGRAAVNLIPGFPPEDSIQAVIPVANFDEGSLVFVTANGTIKRTLLSDYRRPKAGGIIAMGLAEGDRLITVKVAHDDDDLVIGTRNGMSIRFKASDARLMGRPATGVRGIRLKQGDELCGMAVVREGATLLTVCENGYGKRTAFDEYPQQGRGGQGVINIRANDRNGKVVGLLAIGDDEDVMYVSTGGNVVRSPAGEISLIGRGTQGVRLVTLPEGHDLASAARVAPEEDGGDGDGEEAGEDGGGETEAGGARAEAGDAPGATAPEGGPAGGGPGQGDGDRPGAG